MPLLSLLLLLLLRLSPSLSLRHCSFPRYPVAARRRAAHVEEGRVTPRKKLVHALLSRVAGAGGVRVDGSGEAAVFSMELPR